jgi:hypothetical protein
MYLWQCGTFQLAGNGLASTSWDVDSGSRVFAWRKSTIINRPLVARHEDTAMLMKIAVGRMKSATKTMKREQL